MHTTMTKLRLSILNINPLYRTVFYWTLADFCLLFSPVSYILRTVEREGTLCLILCPFVCISCLFCAF